VAAAPDHGRGEGHDAARLLVALPGPLRPPLTWIAGRPVGRILFRTTSGLVAVQIFDRAMTLAAQAFTSLFPILIMVGAIFGADQVAEFASLARMPESSRYLIQETLSDRGPGAFGVAGVLVVLLSSTGLARALARAYASVWEVSGMPSGVRAGWRWLLAVLLVAALLVGTRLAGWLTAGLSQPRLWYGALLLAADCAAAVLLPALLLGRAVPVRMLLPGGLAFALVMLAVRPAGTVYLPRALQTSHDRFGTIGLAFTYIGWLYVMAFCLLVTTVLGAVVARDDSAVGRLFHASHAPAPATGPATTGTPEPHREVATPMDMTPDSTVTPLPAVLRGRHWLQLAAGILAIAVGVTAIAWPSATVQVLGVLFGLNLLVTGAIRAGLLLFVPGYPLLYRVVGIVFGVLTAIVGILCLRNVTASVVLLVVVVAIGWILDGLVSIVLAVGRGGEHGGSGWGVATGLALVLAAVALLVWPKVGLTTLVAIGATVLIFVGIGQVVSALGGMREERRAPA
jgi:membrane protein